MSPKRPPEYPGEDVREYHEGSRRCDQDGRFRPTDLEPYVTRVFILLLGTRGTRDRDDAHA